MRQKKHNIWKIPMILAMLSAFGLLAALLGVRVWHWLAWAAMYTPIIVIIYYMRKSRRRITSEESR